jgi:hypothetical protein
MPHNVGPKLARTIKLEFGKLNSDLVENIACLWCCRHPLTAVLSASATNLAARHTPQSRRSDKDLNWQRMINHVAAEIWIVTVRLRTLVSVLALEPKVVLPKSATELIQGRPQGLSGRSYASSHG